MQLRSQRRFPHHAVSIRISAMNPERLSRQTAFLTESDKLKQILRRTLLADGSRRENSAEHSWHIILTAMVLREYAAEPVNFERVLEMLAVHDLVEIDADDTFAYDAEANRTRAERESQAADRLFGMLPPDLAAELRALWEEFEAHQTAESRFANAVDRFQPFLQNLATDGGTWRIYHPTREQVLRRMDPVRTALPALWPLVKTAIEEFFPSGAASESRN
jgi:putative hydrolase of HD superfamily